MMRRILVDTARANAIRNVVATTNGCRSTKLSPSPVRRPPTSWALDTALTELEAFYRRKCQVVQLRFFGGLSVTETSEALQVSVGTIKRDWRRVNSAKTSKPTL